MLDEKSTNNLSCAVLFAEKKGIYGELDFVDLWHEERDARKYTGELPIVAHPPCSRWCRLAGLVEARWGHKVGDDDGCFEAALRLVRKNGGVIEHPAYSKAFYTYGLPIPRSSKGGWQMGLCGGWSCYVEQCKYGHPAKKATWLYCYGIENPPSLKWGLTPDGECKSLVSWCGNKVKRTPDRPRLGKKAAIATPVEFRDELIKIALSSHMKRSVLAQCV